MAITAYTGLPRSGKSYSVFENVIIPALEQGREIWTNIPFDSDKIIEKYGQVPILFHTDDIRDNDNWFDEVFTSGAVIVIDEVWRLWPSGLRANQVLEQHKSFLAEHGHRVGHNGMSTEVILVTQDLGQVASFARMLVETTYRSVKLDKVGKSKSFRIDIYQGAVTGQMPPEKLRLRQMFSSYKPSVYDLYKSHTMSKTGLAGNETKTDNRANILKSFGVGGLPLVVFGVLCVFFIFFKVFTGFFGDDEPSKSNRKVVQVVERQNKTKSKMEVLDVFKGKDLSIVFNRGHYPDIKYRIRAEDDSDYFVLSQEDMLKLGYAVRPINDCLVAVKVDLKDYFITCRNYENDGMFDFSFGSTDEA